MSSFALSFEMKCLILLRIFCFNYKIMKIQTIILLMFMALGMTAQASDIDTVRVIENPSKVVITENKGIVSVVVNGESGNPAKEYRYDVPVTMYPDGEWYVEPDDMIGYVKTGYEGSTAGNCAKAFFNAWKSMDIDTMLELCSTAWKEEQVNPRVSLLMRMGSGTLLKYAIDEIQAGDSPGNWACPMLTVLMDFGEAGGQEELNASVTVNKEADGRWYLDPDTLRWQ